MKQFTLLISALLVGALVSVNAATPASLYKKNGGNPNGYIIDSSRTAIKFASPSETSPQQTVLFTELRGEGLKLGVVLTDRNGVLAEARDAFGSGDYRKAAASFRKVAEDYPYILNIPNNFATEAKFFEIECYKRAGAYKAMITELNSPAGKTIDLRLGEYYRKSAKMQKLWAVYASGDSAKIEQAISIYQKPIVGDEKLLPTPSYIKMPPADLAQVAFIRGKLYEQKGENQKALADYYRVFTLGQYDSYLSKQAMAAAMKLQSEDPRLQSSGKSKDAAERSLQSLAYTFTKRFQGASLPAQLVEYGKSPRIDIIVPVVAGESAPKAAAKEAVANKPKPKAPETPAKKGKPKRVKPKKKAK